MKIAVDENILIKNEICTAGSKMLYNFKSPYSATVVEKIKAAGMTISCKDKDDADIVLGIDVDGGAYKSAVKDNIFYIKPTYGTVSRFGVVAHVSSVDQIGVYAKNLDDGFAVLSVIAGYDKNDGTSYPTEKYNYSPDGIDIKSLKTLELNINNFKYFDSLAQVYLIISTAEFCNNISRFDGLKFGYRTENFKNMNDLIINSRSESFSAETKIKALMGAYVLSEEQFEKYYYKATQIRRLIKQELDEIFKQFDVVILPLCDKSTALANLTGCPAVVFNGKIMIAKEFDENKLFALGRSMRE